MMAVSQRRPSPQPKERGRSGTSMGFSKGDPSRFQKGSTLSLNGNPIDYAHQSRPGLHQETCVYYNIQLSAVKVNTKSANRAIEQCAKPLTGTFARKALQWSHIGRCGEA